MTDSKIFLDTAPFIYLLDNDENFGDKTNRILSSFVRQNNKLVSSVITCTEYLVVCIGESMLWLPISPFCKRKRILPPSRP